MWNNLPAPQGSQYAWDQKSTYVHEPPFFQSMTKTPPGGKPVKDAYCLLNFGDSITTDHISPAGNINKDSPAAKFLMERGVQRKDFNSYGSRRGNDEIMARGTFANIRIVNKFLEGEVGPKTIHVPSKEKLFIYDAAKVCACSVFCVIWPWTGCPMTRTLFSLVLSSSSCLFHSTKCSSAIFFAEIQGCWSRYYYTGRGRVWKRKFPRLGCQGPLLAGQQSVT